MDDSILDKQISDEVPFYERGPIRPRELTELKNKLRQAEGEVDYYQQVLGQLLSGLGYDSDWASQKGVEDLLKDLMEKIAAGKMTREEFGDIEPGSVVSVIFELVERQALLLGDPVDAEVEQEYQDFWKPIVAPDGKLVLNQVKLELADYSTFLRETAKVYEHITRGRISKQNTIAEAVIAVADDCHQEAIDEAMEEYRLEYLGAFEMAQMCLRLAAELVDQRAIEHEQVTKSLVTLLKAAEHFGGWAKCIRQVNTPDFMKDYWQEFNSFEKVVDEYQQINEDGNGTKRA